MRKFIERIFAGLAVLLLAACNIPDQNLKRYACYSIYSLISTTMESCFLPKIQKSKFLEKTSKGRYGEIKFHRELG